MITPRLLDSNFTEFRDAQDTEIDNAERELSDRTEVVEQHVESVFGDATQSAAETEQE